MAAVGLEINQRRTVEAIEAADQNDIAFNADKLGDRYAEWIRPHGRS